MRNSGGGLTRGICGVIKAVAGGMLTAAGLEAAPLHVEGGAGVWNADPEGSLRYERYSWVSAGDGLGYGTETLPYLWINLEHTLPYVPDLRFEYTGIDYSGRTRGDVAWGPWHYSDRAWSELRLTEYDLIFYYTLLDGSDMFFGEAFLVTLDLGAAIKSIDTRYAIKDDFGLEASYDESTSFFVPQVYLRARAELPQKHLGFETTLQYITNGSSTIYDARLKADYTFASLLTFADPALEVGYRVQRIWIDEPDYDTKVDIDLGGFYLGVMLRY